ncbi:hypothetical protein [Flavobacterium xinjiangense]|uniref:Uncharacterized protein n=1 Tax=Flavobacterium xinjiangense TaxID=178356 RepID=A0A1M7PEP7_9FLAO|nr:hypothetical protein [Flavobacterium xinjiangense]SHN15417.1 hypothetical protein SAMN05216269_11677 [Flavobacterium xinjiangense]
MKNLTIIIFLFLTSVILIPSCSAQEFEEPPRMSMPSAENNLLIDKIIDVTNYETYFKEYCLNYISKTARKENWSKEKIEKIEKSVQLNSFKYRIYNFFSNYSSQRLNNLIEMYKKDKKSKKQNLIIESKMIAEALESHAEFLTLE